MHRPDALDVLRIALLIAVQGCVTIPPNTGSKPVDSGDSGTHTGVVVACAGGTSTPILDNNGVATGFERCDDGTTHRVSVVAVDATIPGASCTGSETSRSCETDADCTSGPHGRCISDAWNDTGNTSNCGCVYSCASDDECGTGQVCVPSNVMENGRERSYCVLSNCSTDADCERGECGISSYNNGCGYDVEMACRDNANACRLDTDCQPQDQYCAVAEAKWQCLSSNCDIGRPLLVEGVARVAPSARRDGWVGVNADLEIPGNAETRAALAKYWLQVAALEHASVGSFARFTLQLLSIGAPPELLADTQLAALDEIRHARFAYGLASRYSSTPMGPGPLNLHGAAPALDVAGIVSGLIAEACVGETLGAAEAAATADACRDPDLGRELRAIADDEARHAALAWRALRWIVTAHSPELHAFAVAELERVVAELSGGAAGEDEADLTEQGVLSPRARATLHSETLSRVVRPLIAALHTAPVTVNAAPENRESPTC